MLAISLLTLLGSAFDVLAQAYTVQEALRESVLSALELGLPISLAFGVVGGLLFGLSQRQVDEHDLRRPNEGMRRSLGNSWRLFLLIGLPGGLAFALCVGVFVGILALFPSGPAAGFASDRWHAAIESGAQVALQYGLPFGVPLGLFVGLLAGLRGLHPYIQHRVLRRQLQRAGAVPPRYECFLDFAADHVLLQRVGGGYRFIHALLLDYFAALPASGETKLAATEAGRG